MTKIFENIEILKQHLSIQPLNTGEIFNYRGMEVDNMEGLHAIEDTEKDCVNLMSGVEFDFFEYRGQTSAYNPCLSGFGRIKDIEDLFLAICRSLYFEQAIQTNPRFTFAKGENICVDSDAIGQHYGLATDYLDITKNFDVATFFATQKYNFNTQQYEPMRENSKDGVIYRITPTFLFMTQYKNGNRIYTPVGWQPFKRPEEQRANAVYLEDSNCFTTIPTVQTYLFKHSYEQSKKVYEMFEGGKTLFPDDDIALFAYKVKEKFSFSLDIIEQSFSQLSKRRGWEDNAKNRENILNQTKVLIEENDNLKWNEKEEDIEKEFCEMIERTRARLTY